MNPLTIILSCSALVASTLQAEELWRSSEPLANFHLKANYHAVGNGELLIYATGDTPLSLPFKANEKGILEVGARQKEGELGEIGVWINGKPFGNIATYGNASQPTSDKKGRRGDLFISSPKQASDPFDLGKDFTIYARFRTQGDGSLISKAIPGKKWLENGKVLFIRKGRLTYDVGWHGEFDGGGKVNDGKWHEAALVSQGGTAKLFLDGKQIASKLGFKRPDPAGALF